MREPDSERERAREPEEPYRQKCKIARKARRVRRAKVRERVKERASERVSK